MNQADPPYVTHEELRQAFDEFGSRMERQIERLAERFDRSQSAARPMAMWLIGLIVTVALGMVGFTLSLVGVGGAVGLFALRSTVAPIERDLAAQRNSRAVLDSTMQVRIDGRVSPLENELEYRRPQIENLAQRVAVLEALAGQ